MTEQVHVNVPVFNVKWYMYRKVTRTGSRHHRVAQGVLTVTICVRLWVFGAGMGTFNFECIFLVRKIICHKTTCIAVRVLTA